MTLRLLGVITVTAGMAFLLTCAVRAEAVVRHTNDRPTRFAVSASSIDPHVNRPQVVSLGFTSNITFTPAFTLYLPAIRQNRASCGQVPTPILPENGSNLNSRIPLFVWDPGSAPTATAFYLEMASDPEFSYLGPVFWTDETQSLKQFRFPFNLAPATTYYWRTYFMCGDARGRYSAAWTFTTGSGGTVLPAPSLVAPADGATLPTGMASLRWSAVPGAVEYMVYWRPAGGEGFAFYWTNDPQFSLGGLSADATYEWWISARNDYAFGPDSGIWRFTTPDMMLQSPGASPKFILEAGSTQYTGWTKW